MSDAAQSPTAAGRIFSPVVAAAMVAVGALALLFFVVFSAYAPDYSGEGDGRANALSRSAVGFAGLVSFLRAQDIPVLISQGLAEEEYEKASLVVLTPSLNNRGAEVLAVTDAEPQLIVLPKWLAAADPLRAGWVRNAGLFDEDVIVERLLEPISQARVSHAAGTQPVELFNGFDGSTVTLGPIESLQTFSGNQWVGYVSDQMNRTILARQEGTDIYVLSDPDLMNTHGLRDLETARTAAAIIQSLRAGDGPVVFDVTLSGYRRSPNLFRLAFEPPLLGATLCALLAALLMGVHAAVRFGAAQDGGRALALGKQALADNSAALIAMVGREHRIVPRYAAAIRRRVARIVGVPPDTREDVLNELLDHQRRRNAPAQPLADLMAEARRANDAGDALRVARKLYRWKRDMIHES